MNGMLKLKRKNYCINSMKKYNMIIRKTFLNYEKFPRRNKKIP